MLKSMITTSLITLALLMSGCGGDTEGESVLETQKMLDDGDFSGVISKLEGSANSDDDYINLASAYMGHSGLTLTNLVTSILNANDQNSNDSTFANFIKAVSDTTSPTALSDLRKSTSNYKEIIGSGCDNATLLTTPQKDICLFVGLSNMGSAAVAINFLTGSISSFGLGNGIDNKLTASICAMGYAATGTIDSGCTIADTAPINFLQSGKTYDSFDVVVNGETFYYLKNDANRTITTSGYCSNTNFSTRTEIKQASYYACPLNELTGEDDFTTTGVLVEVLNDGLGAISGAGSEDIAVGVDEFRCEIINETFDGTSCSSTRDVSEIDIVNYLKQQNQ